MEGFKDDFVLDDAFEMLGVVIVEVSEQAKAGSDKIDFHLIGGGTGGIFDLGDFPDLAVDGENLQITEQAKEAKQTQQDSDNPGQFFVDGQLHV